jgi:fructose-bisphosphate aldolase, class II
MLLTPIQAQELIQHALVNRYAVLAVNADSPAAITDCLDAARAADAPIIIETSLWQLVGRSFGSGDPFSGMARYLAQIAVLAESETYRNVPIVFHTDHIKGEVTLPLLKAAITGIPFQFGDAETALTASTISLDSSELTDEENISHVCTLCRAAEAGNRPLTFEMEAGVDDGLTPPEVTRRLLSGVEESHPGRIWLWAPGLGTQHGFSTEGYPTFSAENVAAQRTLAQEITGREIGIALHGSSGLAPERLREAVEAGVVKVNWSSESLALRSSLAARYYADNADKLQRTHPLFKVTAMDNGVQNYVAASYLPVVQERIELLGGAGYGTAFCHRYAKDA